MLPDQQDRVVVVLVRARNPSNIGASARAIHDLGFSRLRIVNEFPVPFQAALAAERAAVDASSVLESALQFPTVAEAVADCNLVFGTTAVGERVLEHPLQLLGATAQTIGTHLAAHPASRIAILFGSEKTGLSNDELSHCHALLTIPMNPRTPDRHLSMNLGQSVAVILYTLANTAAEDRVPHLVQPHRMSWDEESTELATSGETERMTTLLRLLLDISGYTRRHPANSRESILRRLVRRMALNPTDTQVWTGILRQFQHALAHHAHETEPPPTPSKPE